jgi:hypothetical protein
MVSFTASFDISSLLSNNACCTVTFRTRSNTSSLIGKQVVYGLTLADNQVPIKFMVKHMRGCDAEAFKAMNADNLQEVYNLITAFWDGPKDFAEWHQADGTPVPKIPNPDNPNTL